MTTAANLIDREELDLEKRSSTSRHFEEELRQRVVGQNEAVQALVDLYQMFCAGLHSLGRPVGNLLFLGPTGSGKMRTDHLGERGLVFLRDTENRSADPKIDFRLANSGQLMAAEARV